LEKIGGSVLLGGLSTFLGVVPLAFSSREVFVNFFILFSLMAALGISHGLIFLPVVLAILGPNL
jgi:Niemann-Pick C1 protein